MFYTWGNSESLRLALGDLIRVVSEYTNGKFRGPNGEPIGGAPPAAIGLHPWILDPELAPVEWRGKYRAISRELAADIGAVKAEGIEVIPVAGLLGWQIALCPTEDSFYNTPSQIEAQGPVPVAKSVVESGGFILLPPHRPRVFGEDIDHRIEALMEKGLGARAICRLLTADGITISLSSVSKRLQQFRSWSG